MRFKDSPYIPTIHSVVAILKSKGNHLFPYKKAITISIYNKMEMVIYVLAENPGQNN